MEQCIKCQKDFEKGERIAQIIYMTITDEQGNVGSEDFGDLFCSECMEDVLRNM